MIDGYDLALIVDEVIDAMRGNMRRMSVVSVDDSGTQQLVNLTGLKNEAPQNVVRSQHFGLSSVPPAGGEGLILEQGGRADRAHVLALEHKDYRPRNYQTGDTVLYDAHGQAISLVKQNLRIVASDTLTLQAKTINCNATSQFVVTSPDVELGGVGGVLVKRCDGSCASKVKAV